MTRDDPISDAELAHLFTGLEEYRLLVLAVSGGPDSTALMHLMSRWRLQRLAEGLPVPRVEIATVDHRLRPQSQAEARAVARAARRLGLPHRTLVWSETNPQAVSRKWRARHAMGCSPRTSSPSASPMQHFLQRTQPTIRPKR